MPGRPPSAVRSAPPLQVTIRRFDRWQGCVALLAALAAATLAGWIGSRLASSTASTSVAVLVSCALAAVLGWRGSRRAPLRLRWDGQQWHLGSAAGAIDHDVAGCPRPMIDLGSWLMVAFENSGSVTGHVWLPLQRRGLERDWHALRCALYAVPGGGIVAADQPRSAAAARPPIE